MVRHNRQLFGELVQNRVNIIAMGSFALCGLPVSVLCDDGLAASVSVKRSSSICDTQCGVLFHMLNM